MSTPFTDLPFKTHFQQLPSAFYAFQQPEGLEQPELVIASGDCARWMGLDASSLTRPETVALLSGNTTLQAWQPLAMKYFGHQFGYLNPDLGDGRGCLLAEIETPEGELLDLHLKGAGPTPFARQGDGRAVLRSSIREFLGSEAMHALGIPTTRALCVLNSQTPVQREQMESGATLLRVSRSHIRFGHFEFAYHSGDPELLTALADYVLERHFPCLERTPTQYADLFLIICKRTAEMIAKWQCVGFAHGVMNTDNMSILGETFDYGPFGFQDAFQAGYICNHSDTQGRYAFDRQPAIGQWNLSVLAQAMSPIVERDALVAGLEHYNETFNQQYLKGMLDKLGLSQADAGEHSEADQNLVMEALTLMQENRLDYTRFFRAISENDIASQNAQDLSELRDHCVNIKAFDQWFHAYQQRCQQENSPPGQRLQAMQACNPVYVLRNHLAQTAIEQAQAGDYSEVQRLHKVLQQPYTRQADCDHYEALPPDWAQDLEISCSS
ncbi:MAG: YdiU family protein [Oleiphilus sp.]|nr:MAG: YdiU family protein [Oleiphilus sp.]